MPWERPGSLRARGRQPDCFAFRSPRPTHCPLWSSFALFPLGGEQPPPPPRGALSQALTQEPGESGKGSLSASLSHCPGRSRARGSWTQNRTSCKCAAGSALPRTGHSGQLDMQQKGAAGPWVTGGTKWAETIACQTSLPTQPAKMAACQKRENPLGKSPGMICTQDWRKAPCPKPPPCRERSERWGEESQDWWLGGEAEGLGGLKSTWSGIASLSGHWSPEVPPTERLREET